MKLCLSISPATVTEAASLLRAHRNSADIIEVRIDSLPSPDLREILRGPRPEVIITNRTIAEGGSFGGSEETSSKMYSDAIAAGAEYIDVELTWGRAFVNRLRKLSRRTKIILSSHDFSGAPSDVSALYSKARRVGADIIKIAFAATTLRDNDVVFELYERAKRDRQKLIAIAMGPFGEISRILPAMTNGMLTYGALADHQATAPGQFSADELLKLYRVRAINSRTKIFGLLGNPVQQSKGRYFHNGIFGKKRLNAVYLNFLIDDLPHFIKQYAPDLTGSSVTMPFKQDVMPYLDTMTLEAKELGAVNTIIRRRGKMSGSNTDLTALVSILKEAGIRQGRDIVILGTGATSATMAFAAHLLGARVRVAGRNPAKAAALAARFGLESTALDGLTEAPCDLLMSAIPYGGSDKHPAETNTLPDALFRKRMTVFDAVYNPPMTPLLNRARSAGCTVIGGTELFQRQAKLQSKLFVEAI